MSKQKSEFWWATVAGADCEPVEVRVENGERLAFTCGCNDPFYLDRPDCPVVLVPEFNPNKDDGAMERPLTPKQEKRERERERRQQAALLAHNWRGPR